MSTTLTRILSSHPIGTSRGPLALRLTFLRIPLRGKYPILLGVRVVRIARFL